MASKSDDSGTAERVERDEPLTIGNIQVRAYVPNPESVLAVKGMLERARGMELGPAVDAVNRIFNGFVTRHLVDPDDIINIELEMLDERASVTSVLEAFLSAEPTNRSERRAAAKSARRAPARRAAAGA